MAAEETLLYKYEERINAREMYYHRINAIAVVNSNKKNKTSLKVLAMKERLYMFIEKRILKYCT